jgi:hypothetical protein
LTGLDLLSFTSVQVDKIGGMDGQPDVSVSSHHGDLLGGLLTHSDALYKLYLKTIQTQFGNTFNAFNSGKIGRVSGRAGSTKE